MEINKIQSKINEDAEKQVNAEFIQAVEKCREILKPFFVGKNSCSGDLREEQEKLLEQLFYLDHGSLECKKFSAPKITIKNRQEKASVEFIERVSNLVYELDEIREIAENNI